jgi:hypothetical protein
MRRRPGTPAIEKAHGKLRVKKAPAQTIHLSECSFDQSLPTRLALARIKGHRLVTKEASCRAVPDLWGAWVDNHPGLPGPRSPPSSAVLRPLMSPSVTYPTE